MAKKPESDPTKDPDFQKVVDYFLKTPPKPHDDGKKRKRSSATGAPVKGKRSKEK